MEPKPPDKPENIIEIPTYKWGEYTNKQFEENVSSIYEKNIYWKILFFFYLLVKEEDALYKKLQG